MPIELGLQDTRGGGICTPGTGQNGRPLFTLFSLYLGLSVLHVCIHVCALTTVSSIVYEAQGHCAMGQAPNSGVRMPEIREPHSNPREGGAIRGNPQTTD